MFYPQAAPGFVGSVKLSVASAEASPAYPGALPLAGPCTTAYLPFALDSAPWFHLAPSSGSRSLILKHNWLEGGGWASVPWGSLRWTGLETVSGLVCGCLQCGALVLVGGVRNRFWGSSPPPPKDIKTHSTHLLLPPKQRDLAA